MFSQALTPEEFREKGVDKMEKARARAEFFHNRVVPANGIIPRGAQLKAFNSAMEDLHSIGLRKGAGAETLPWVNIGPFNIGGRLKAVAINPLNPMTMFVGAAGGGVWRSFDEGLNWHSVSDLFPTQAMGSIVINPVDTNIVYAGTGEASFGGHSYDGAGLFKSTDGGTTWSQAGGGILPDYARISMMAINPINPDIVFASVAAGARDADDFGIWRTKDAGATWEHVFTTTTTDVVINPVNPDILYTVGTKIFGTGFAPAYGMHKSTDGGDSWVKQDMGIVDSLMGRTGLAICASQPDVVYASVSELTGGRTALMGIFKTTDGGATWAKKEVPFDYLTPQGWFDNVMAVNPTNPDIVYAGGVKCVRSSDGGDSWDRVKDQLGGGILHVDQHAMAFNPQDTDRFFVGNDGGLFLITDEGKTLEKRDIGLSITQFIGGDFHPSDSRFIFGGTQDNGTMRSPDSDDFELVLYGDGGYGYVHPTKPNIMWTTQEVGKLFRSEDHGRTWYRVIGDMPADGALFYAPYDLDKNNPETLFMGTYRVYKTQNEGRNWDRLQSGLFPTGTGSFYFITSLDIADYNSDVILAGAPLGSVAISTDGGGEWTQIGDSLVDGYVSSVRSFADGEIYVTMSTFEIDKVFKSVDGGQTWTNKTGNLPDIPARDIWKLENTLFLATDLGAFVSEDDGQTWLLMTNGMPTVPVERFYFNEQMQILRAYTHGRGIYDLQWKTPADKAPVFESTPDTDMLEFGQRFRYAPVVEAWPMPTYSLEAAPANATIDPVLGTVQWKGGAKVAPFTIKAENSAGSTTQEFTLTTNDAPLFEWRVMSDEPMSTGVNIMRWAGGKTLWVGRDSAWVSRSTNGGVDFDHFNVMQSDISIIGVHAFDDQRAIVGTGGPQSMVNTGEGYLLKTTDGGQNWAQVLYGVDSRFGNIHFWDDMNGIVVSQGAKDSADVWLTSDGGDSWQLQSPRAWAPIPFYNTLRFADRNIGFYVTSDRDDNGRVMRTEDGGLSWTERPVPIRFASELALLSDKRGFFVDEFTGQVFRTANGITWGRRTYPMSGMRNSTVDADPQGRYAWVVNDSTAWTTNNFAQSWHMTRLIPTGPTQDAVFADSVTGWVIGKNGIVQSLVRNPIVSAEGLEVLQLQQFVLGESYPNPAQAGNTVIIPFTLSSQMPVSLKIFNSSGKEILTLLEQSFVPGTHYSTWNTTSLAAGTYFYTLKSGQQSATGRISIVN
jgi:photosystem II stability/assembly factor-like uncharacterized protein